MLDAFELDRAVAGGRAEDDVRVMNGGYHGTFADASLSGLDGVRDGDEATLATGVLEKLLGGVHTDSVLP